MSDSKQTDSGNNSALRKEMVSIGRNSVWYLVAQALSRAVGFFMIPVYTRFISPTNYGAMELIEILASVVAMTISMGVGESMARFYYQEKDARRQNEIISTVVIGFGVVSIPVVLFFLYMSDHIASTVSSEPVYTYYMQIAFASVWFGMLVEIGYSYLRMLYKARLFVVITMSQLFSALILNIYFIVFLDMDILGIFYSTLITQAVSGLLMMAYILRATGVRVSGRVLSELVLLGMPLVPARIGTMLGFASNRFFLRWQSPLDPAMALAQVGLFSLGHKFGLIINRFINSPFNSFWAPRRLEILLKEEEESERTIARVCTYATMLSLYGTLALSAGVQSLIEIIAVPSYWGAHVVVPFVALAYVALGLETHFMSGMLYKKKTLSVTYIGMIGLGVVLVWNYVMIPDFGLIGAATSNLAGFTVRVGLIYYISQRLHYIPFELGRMAVMLVVAVIMYIVSQLINTGSPYYDLVLRTGFAMTFPLVLLLIGFYKAGEVRFARDVMRKGQEYLRARFA